jgi:hypothetical protein
MRPAFVGTQSSAREAWLSYALLGALRHNAINIGKTFHNSSANNNQPHGGTTMADRDNKTHYRKAFNSPYLASADIVEPTILQISHVRLESDRTKKTKDLFNTAHFVDKELRPGEPLKPMILNATNSRTMKQLTGSPFIDDWNNVYVTVYVDHNVRMMGETVEGLRISTEHPRTTKPEVTPDKETMWANAIAAYKRDGNFDKIEERATITDENKSKLIEAANALA